MFEARSVILNARACTNTNISYGLLVIHVLLKYKASLPDTQRKRVCEWGVCVIVAISDNRVQCML